LSRAPLCIDDFILEKPVGRGGMGEVWGATHRFSKARVAIKLLSDQRAKNVSYHNVFRREMRAAACLDHPNIVTIHDYGTIDAAAAAASAGRLTEGSPYLVMELVEGGSISKHRGRLPWPELRELLLDLLGALAHAHARGIVHRDIKFGNVLLGESGVRLTDFGLAHGIFYDDMGNAPGGGTPTYMSPEQFQGRWREFGPWTDLYALGCMAWILVTGKPPFGERGWTAKMHAHLTRPPPPLISRVALPLEFEGWLRGMLRKDPRLRFRRAADAAHALRQLGEPSGQLRRKRRAMDRLEPDEDTAVGKEAIGDPSLEVMRERKETQWDWGQPPVPLDWREQETRPLYGFCGAGLGLFGFRSIPVVGRDEERNQLWSAMTQVYRDRRARVVTLLGAAGIGKSCLAEWLCRRSHELGVGTILRTTHHPIPGRIRGLSRLVADYYLCSDLHGEELESYLEETLIAEGEVAEWEWFDLAEMIDPTRSEGPRFDSPTARYALIQRCFARISEERPLVVFVDDAHWGLESLELASYILRYYADTPVLFVFAVNDSIIADRPAEREALADLQRFDDYSGVLLDVLDPTAMSLLIRELLQMSGELPERVQGQVGGNPLYAVQLVSNLIQQGVLIPGEHGLELRPGAKMELPVDELSSWHEQLDRVLSGLPDEARRVLEIGVALGTEIRREEWLLACEEAGLQLQAEWVEALVRACLLREYDGAWRLAHRMLANIVEQIARDSGRWSMHHACCARAIRACYPRGAVGLAGRLGRHLVQAGERETAVDLLLEGAEEELAESEYRTAHSYLDYRDRAVEELALSPRDIRRIDGLLVRVQIYRHQGLLTKAKEFLKRVAEALESNETVEALATYHSETARVFLVSEVLDEAEHHFEIALKLYQALGLRRKAAECTLGLGEAYTLRGNYTVALEFIERARDGFEALGADVEVAWSIRMMSRVFLRRGELDRAEGHQWAAMKVFERYNKVSQIAHCQRAISIISTTRGNYDYAAMWNERALALFDRCGDPLGRQSCLNGFGEIARFRGRLQEAERNYRAALAHSRQSGTHDWTIPKVNLGLVLLTQEKFSAAHEALTAALDALLKSNRMDIAGGVELAIAVCLLVAGQITEAEERFESGLLKIKDTGILDADIAGATELFGDKASATGHTELARRAWNLAVSHWERLGDAEREVAAQAKLTWLG
jgi:tetratricopeptide (TPR) repeat protein